MSAFQKASIRYAAVGEPGLLVLEVPPEIATGEVQCASYAIPIMARRSGMLLCVPVGVLSADALELGNAADDDSLLGPSLRGSAPLIEELEDGAVQAVGVETEFIVADFDDRVLEFLRDYDPAHDAATEIMPFYSAAPSGLPDFEKVLDAVKNWTKDSEISRANFYSAREEPDGPPLPKIPKTKKGAQPKRVTTATLAEQVAALTSQMQTVMSLLQSPQTPAVLREQRDGHATHAQEQTVAGLATLGPSVPKIPALSSALAAGPRASPKDLASSCGASSKGQSGASQVGRRRQRGFSRRGDGGPVESDSRPNVGSSDKTVIGVANFGCSSSRSEQRSHGGSSSHQFGIQCIFDERSCKKGEDGVFSGDGHIQFLATVPAAALPQNAPIKASPQVRCRSQAVGPKLILIPGKVWRLQRPEGLGTDLMDCVRCGRLSRRRRLGSGEGALVPPCLFARTGSNGWDVGDRFSDQLGTRPTVPTVPRQDIQHERDESFLSDYADRMGCYTSRLPQGVGHLAHQKVRNQESSSTRKSSSRGCREGRVSKKEASFPKEAKSFGGSVDLQVRKDGKLQDTRTVNAEVSTGVAVHDECPASGKSTCPSKNSLLQHSPCKVLSYSKWCAGLIQSVLRTRTPFSSFVAKSISLPRVPCTAPSFFPIPLPLGEWFRRMKPELSQKKRHRIHLNRALSIMVLALNFWYSGGPVSGDLLGRTPNSMHLAFFRRVRKFIRAEGSAVIPDITATGRRIPQLVARLSELSGALTAFGPSCNPYDRTFHGLSVPVDLTQAEELRPYRSLEASRLKISGKGAWSPDPYLSDDLLMAFREPDLIHIEGRVPPAGAFPVCTDKQSEVAELAKVWDARGLLYVIDSAYHDAHPFEAVKVFNCYKNLDVDRQIGDRRGRIYTEAKIVGPSASLPCGPDLCSLYCNIACDRLAIGVTDRKDYYHQLKVTPSKAFYNAVGPPIPCSLVAETEGYKEYLERSRPRRYVRERKGDQLAPRSLLVDSPGHVRIAFKSVFQGDHAGVDFATCAHVNFLQSRGFLNDDSRIVSTAALQSRDLCQGLVIDDFFVISREKQGSDIHKSVAAQKLEQAQQAYQQDGILGSPEKDVLGFKAKVVGATVNTGDDAVKQGIALVSAPIEKRLALSAISLEAARLSHCTDALMVCLVGGWISALMYRRPMMSLFSQCFKAADMSEVDADNPKLIPLSRKVANELVLVSVLMPLIASEISAPWLDTVFCTDASNEKGAYCKAKVPEQLSEVVWKNYQEQGRVQQVAFPS